VTLCELRRSLLFGNPITSSRRLFPAGAPIVGVNPGFAWNHGGAEPDIINTFLGIAGRAWKVSGVTNAVWSDHTDIRPTMLSLVGLKDDLR